MPLQEVEELTTSCGAIPYADKEEMDLQTCLFSTMAHRWHLQNNQILSYNQLKVVILSFCKLTHIFAILSFCYFVILLFCKLAFFLNSIWLFVTCKITSLVSVTYGPYDHLSINLVSISYIVSLPIRNKITISIHILLTKCVKR